MSDTGSPFADVSLAWRLERAEAHGNARAVEARARLFSDSGACWIEVAGASAMFDGPASPLTQTFGLGKSQAATAEDLTAIEAFYRERGAPVCHEVSPLARRDAPRPAERTRLPSVRIHQRALSPDRQGRRPDGRHDTRGRSRRPSGLLA